MDPAFQCTTGTRQTPRGKNTVTQRLRQARPRAVLPARNGQDMPRTSFPMSVPNVPNLGLTKKAKYAPHMITRALCCELHGAALVPCCLSLCHTQEGSPLHGQPEQAPCLHAAPTGALCLSPRPLHSYCTSCTRGPSSSREHEDQTQTS
jgi:hypothetical protein